MTELDVMNDLMFCEHADCTNCSRENSPTCIKELMRDARGVIKMQIDALRLSRESVKNLEKENAELIEKVKVGYTKEQLVESVNDIIDCFTDGEDYDDRMEAQLRAIGSFMRLAHLHGHIAVNRNADRMQIQLDK